MGHVHDAATQTGRVGRVGARPALGDDGRMHQSRNTNHLLLAVEDWTLCFVCGFRDGRGDVSTLPNEFDFINFEFFSKVPHLSSKLK